MSYAINSLCSLAVSNDRCDRYVDEMGLVAHIPSAYSAPVEAILQRQTKTLYGQAPISKRFEGQSGTPPAPPSVSSYGGWGVFQSGCYISDAAVSASLI
jgi:hypothetical protein